MLKLELKLRFIQNFTIFNRKIPFIVDFCINNNEKNESLVRLVF